MADFGLSPKEAAIRSMEEVSGAIIGITFIDNRVVIKTLDTKG